MSRAPASLSLSLRLEHLQAELLAVRGQLQPHVEMGLILGRGSRPVAQPLCLCGPPLAVSSVMRHIVFKAIGTSALSSGCVGGIEVCAGKVFGTQSKLWATKVTEAKRR